MLLNTSLKLRRIGIMKNENKKILFLSICILILLGLMVATNIKNNQSSCDTCMVKFTTERVSGVQLTQPIVFDVQVNELYSKLLNDGICVVSFDRTQGYKKNG